MHRPTLSVWLPVPLLWLCVYAHLRHPRRSLCLLCQARTMISTGDPCPGHKASSRSLVLAYLGCAPPQSRWRLHARLRCSGAVLKPPRALHLRARRRLAASHAASAPPRPCACSPTPCPPASRSQAVPRPDPRPVHSTTCCPQVWVALCALPLPCAAPRPPRLVRPETLRSLLLLVLLPYQAATRP